MKGSLGHQVHILITGVPEGEEKREKMYWGNNTWKLPKPGKGTRHPGWGSTESSKKMNSRWSIPRHIIIKMPKFKDKENFQGKCYKGNPLRLSSEFSAEILQAMERVAWYI